MATNHFHNYKDLLISVISFIVPFLIIMLILDPLIFNYLAFGIRSDQTIIDEYYINYHEYSDMYLDNSEKILFVGASQTKHGINCDYIENNLENISCYNTGAPGDVPYYRISELPLIIKSAPSLVFLEITPKSFSELSTLPDFKNNLYIRYGLAGIHQNDEEISSWSFPIRDKDKKYIPDSYREMYEFRSNYRQQVSDSRAEIIFEGLLKDDNSAKDKWSQEDLSTKESKLNLFINDPSWQPSNSSVNIYCLEYMIDSLESNGIKVILYSPPYDPLLIDNLPEGHWDLFNITTQKMIDEGNLTYLNYSFERWSSSEFKDLTHLYDGGIIRLSDILVKEIKIIL